MIPAILRNLDLESEEGRQLTRDCVDFIRSYADSYHHAKEEDILFKYFDEDMDILKAMHQDHTQARAHARAILEAVERRDKNSVHQHMTAYGELLTEHIRKEDEILYPWMERSLSPPEIENLHSRFNEADARMGERTKKYESFVQALEKGRGHAEPTST